jgi:type IV secretion system protein VirD4
MLFVIDKKIMRILTKKPTLDMGAYSGTGQPPPKLFVRIPHNKIEYYSNFVNLFFTFLTIALDNRPDGQGEKLMIFFDEVAQFGNLHKLVGVIDTIASKNVILLLCMQALSQFYKYYGEHDTKTMINNCDTQIILKILDPDTQEFFSKRIGTMEIKRQSQSANFDVDTGQEKGRGENNYIQEIRIVKPETMAYLAEKREIIFLSGKGYCKVRHVRYYEKNEFKQRLIA